MILVRQEIGEVLRDFRQQKGRTLRQVASRASVALGYLSEVERGQKEASSELLASLCEALDISLADVLREVSHDIAVLERAPLAPLGFATTPQLAATAVANRPVAVLPKVSAVLAPKAVNSKSAVTDAVVAATRMPVVAA